MTRQLCLAILLAAAAQAQQPPVVLMRSDRTIVLEPYAPNIVRVTMSLLRKPALAGPGYGFVASPTTLGWTTEATNAGDIYRSSRLVVTVAAEHPSKPMATELDIAKFFGGSAPPTHILIATPEGKTLLDMQLSGTPFFPHCTRPLVIDGSSLARFNGTGEPVPWLTKYPLLPST